MHKVIIVDDETIVSRGLAEKIDWDQLNCKVVGIGNNGLEGKTLIDRLKPDIVITDIKMPGMNGLDLAQYVKEQYPSCVTILLSGYSEFDYARTAVRHQVFDYLLKPVDLDDLKKCIRKAQNHQNSIRKFAGLAKQAEADEIRKAAMAEIGILLNVIVNGNKDIDTFDRKLAELGSPLHKGQTIIFERYEHREDLQSASLFQYAIQNIVQETLDNFKMKGVLFNHEGKIVLVIKYSQEIKPTIYERRVLEAIETCRTNIVEYLKTSVNIGIGPVFEGLCGLHASYAQAARTLEENLFWGYRHLLPGNVMKGDVGPSVPVDPAWLEAIGEGKEEEARRGMVLFLQAVRRAGNKTYAFNRLIDVMVGLTRHVSDPALKMRLTKKITDIPSIRTFTEYSAALEEIIETICAKVRNDLDEVGSPLISRVLAYIDMHYHENWLSLQTVAAHYNVSEGHLSRLFKKETGTNFSEYLVKKRVDKAMELLNRNAQLPVAFIADRVGFMDAKYFGQVFKKYMGMTPSEYKERTSVS